MLTTVILSLLALTSDSLRITGSCYNLADQGSLKCNITVVFNTGKHKINTDKWGKFAFNLPDSARYLTFEAAGFEARTIGVNRIGKETGEATFAIRVPMLKNGLDPAIKEDETVFPKSQLIVDVNAPDSLTMAVVLVDGTKRRARENRGTISGPTNRHLTVNYIVPGPCMLYTGIFEQKDLAVSEQWGENVVLKEGFNFLTVKYRSTNFTNDGTIAMLKPKTLYFDQSSYNLRKDSRLILDSVCAVLVRRHNLTARVTGHTDNVGKQNLNLILSEYRARVVQHYMKSNGVKPGQIRAEWKGPYFPVAANDSEVNKSKNRRVEITFRER
ncbi:OmpA family protein [Dyadobacter aurulentus]|uniref:OmpA family protein n=1 Tax=Dyadobacter sp. UC 10 TaxID=2605428 RepID=UPI0011F38260|nr:OmpA family protein [Dyadobacter sp. UC 10]KAA0993833.1 OmpA family protein [Dyadobacter sp. UC 10]